jgi:hypothetical protein
MRRYLTVARAAETTGGAKDEKEKDEDYDQEEDAEHDKDYE